ncbi:MAG: hypothetical protein ACTSQ4_08135 [Candidatus Heimdallarchaeaceae archaeon]
MEDIDNTIRIKKRTILIDSFALLLVGLWFLFLYLGYIGLGLDITWFFMTAIFLVVTITLFGPYLTMILRMKVGDYIKKISDVSSASEISEGIAQGVKVGKVRVKATRFDFVNRFLANTFGGFMRYFSSFWMFPLIIIDFFIQIVLLIVILVKIKKEDSLPDVELKTNIQQESSTEV